MQTQTETEAQTDVKTVLYLQSETKPWGADYELRTYEAT